MAIESWKDLFALFDGPADLGRALGCSRQAAHEMINLRGYITASRWPKLVEAAAERKIKGITPEVLGRLATQRPPDSRIYGAKIPAAE